MYNKLLDRSFSNEKALLSTTRTSYIIVRKNYWNAFRVWLNEKQLRLLRGISARQDAAV